MKQRGSWVLALLLCDACERLEVNVSGLPLGTRELLLWRRLGSQVDGGPAAREGRGATADQVSWTVAEEEARAAATRVILELRTLPAGAAGEVLHLGAAARDGQGCLLGFATGSVAALAEASSVDLTISKEGVTRPLCREPPLLTRVELQSEEAPDPTLPAVLRSVLPSDQEVKLSLRGFGFLPGARVSVNGWPASPPTWLDYSHVQATIRLPELWYPLPAGEAGPGALVELRNHDDAATTLRGTASEGPMLFASTLQLNFSTYGANQADRSPCAATGVAAWDVNRDGLRDLVIGCSGGLRWHQNPGDGDFSASPRKELAAVGPGPVVLQTADLDRDGREELIVVEEQQGLVRLVRSDGSAATLIDVAPGPQAVVAADLNGDGWLDLAVTSTRRRALSLLYSDPRRPGRAFMLDSLVLPDIPVSLASGDLNGDRRSDLVVSTLNGQVLLALRQDMAGQRPLQRLDFTGLDLRSIAIADLDLDGRQDLAIASYATDSVTVLLQGGAAADGALRFSAQPLLGLRRPAALVATDLNRDRLPDLAVISDEEGLLYVLKNRWRGVFQLQADMPRGRAGESHSLLVTELTGDDLPELLTHNSSNMNVTVFTNASH